MEQEIWKEIPGFSNYEVSNLGRVKARTWLLKSNGGVYVKKEQILRQNNLSGRGYLSVNLTESPNKLKAWRVHRLVAICHIGAPPSPLHQVNHKNGIKGDNRSQNLEWCTGSENIQHAIRAGLKPPVSLPKKLNSGKVKEIRQLFLDGLRYAEIAKMYGVCRQMINNIRLKKVWLL